MNEENPKICSRCGHDEKEHCILLLDFRCYHQSEDNKDYCLCPAFMFESFQKGPKKVKAT